MASAPQSSQTAPLGLPGQHGILLDLADGDVGVGDEVAHAVLLLHQLVLRHLQAGS